MEASILLTLRHGSRERVFSVADEAQVVVWLGFEEPLDVSHAMASVQGSARGLLVKPCYGYRLVVPGVEEAMGDGVVLDRATSVVLGILDDATTGAASLHARPVTPGLSTFRHYPLADGMTFEIGRDAGCALRYANALVSGRHALVRCEQSVVSVQDLRSANGTLVNGVPLRALQPHRLKPGDIVQVLDLVLVAGAGFVSANAPEGVTCGGILSDAHAQTLPEVPVCQGVGDGDGSWRRPFCPAPRLTRSVPSLRLDVDAPPAAYVADDRPAIMQIGPSFVMGLASVFTGANAIAGILGGGSVLAAMPSLAMSVSMVVGSLVWPLVSRRYERRRRAAEDAWQANSYVAYLDTAEDRMLEAAQRQSQALAESLESVARLAGLVDQRSPLLMSHTADHRDFMCLRVGVGDLALDASVTWPERHFSVTDDKLWRRVDDLAAHPPMLRDVPVSCDLRHNVVVGVVGERQLAWEFVRGLLLQVCARYSYQDVKVALVVDDRERHEWEFMTSTGHLCQGPEGLRLVATTPTGLNRLDRWMASTWLDDERSTSERLETGRHVVVVCANPALSDRSTAIGRMLRMRESKGFSLVFLGGHLHELPRECGYIVDLGDRLPLDAALGDKLQPARRKHRTARMFSRADVHGTLRHFDPDIMVAREQAASLGLGLAKIHLALPGKAVPPPESLGLLELYRAGRVAHLDVAGRWVANDASRSLCVPVGVGEGRREVSIDLHERAQGPHALIAGTTGSGKSEFIMTLILSLCVNFSPEQVAFVLIDYKGGGLAGSFERKDKRLPHLSGVMTNLDGARIRRSLVSIQSELRRRQEAFNRAKEVSGDATMDIHRYLALHRQGILREAIPHLFIVADEFAELKQQEPAFMEELVSAARIGRSLGVHLVLATQRPSGVVDEQIWANARLKVALKVSDAADSREVIRTDIASSFERPGQFYALVGYSDDAFEGQSAYAGGGYLPVERFVPKTDTAVELLDGEGEPVVGLRPVPSEKGKAGCSELSAIMDELCDVAHRLSVEARPLWLPELPMRVTLGDLDERYGAVAQQGLGCVVGEVDDPVAQRQFRLELDFAQVGNVLVYGGQGSEAEQLQRAMAVSAIMAGGAPPLWVYAFDFGEGLMAALGELAQVGGIASTGDDEAVTHLVRLLTRELNRRRGDLARQDLEVRARVLVLVTNLAALVESYPEVEDWLVTATRDAPRHGMHFLVLADSAGAVRMRLKSNFGMVLPCALNDASDYLALLGNLDGMAPPRLPRRGLVRLDERLLEFQGITLGADESEEQVILRLAQASHGDDASVPPPIPRLPKRVLAGDSSLATLQRQLPIGLSHKDVEPLGLRLDEHPTVLVCSNSQTSLAACVRGLCAAMQQVRLSYRLVDMGDVLGLAESPCVLGNAAAVRVLLDTLVGGDGDVDVVVVMDAAQTLGLLPADTCERLKASVCAARPGQRPTWVFASEAWCLAGIYEDWYRVMSAQGSGLWVGNGFTDQTVFRFGRALPEYRASMAANDGFLVSHGEIRAVRVIDVREGT